MDAAYVYCALSLTIASFFRYTEMLEVSSFIIDGTTASDLTFPWQLSFQRRVKDNWSHTCGAVLIDKGWALTASHCVYNRSAQNPDGSYSSYRISDMRVIAGVTRISPLGSDAEEHYFKRVITPYGLSIYFDVALLEFEVEADTNRSDVTPILIANNTEPVSTGDCRISGWGAVNRRVQKFSPVLQQARTKLLTIKQCVDSGWPVRDTHVCVEGQPKGVSGCFGDSGGPLTCYRENGTPVLMGIASFVYGRCFTLRPNVFARASIYRRWLRRLTKIDNI